MKAFITKLLVTCFLLTAWQTVAPVVTLGANPAPAPVPVEVAPMRQNAAGTSAALSGHATGTVLGVIDAFVGIASKGSGNIGAVAPGVAEALIATAAALSVAIPAVFAYNIFAARLNKIEGQLESFGSELIALMVREGMI